MVTWPLPLLELFFHSINVKYLRFIVIETMKYNLAALLTSAAYSIYTSASYSQHTAPMFK